MTERSPKVQSPAFESHVYNPHSAQQYGSSFQNYGNTLTTRTYSPTTNTSPKPFSPNKSPISFDYNQPYGLSSNKYESSGPYGDGYGTTEYVTNTYKTPDGFKSDMYKYESYKSSSQPTGNFSMEKIYTSTPSKETFSPIEKKSFESFKNGNISQSQTSFSTNVEYVNEPPVLKNTDTLEQKMIKKAVTQQIIEKKTVSTTRSSRQESSSKSFRFD